MEKVAIFILLILLAGCGAVDSVTGGYEHAQEVAADLEKSTGVKPLVGFSWSNGFLTEIRINFEGIPANTSLTELAKLSRNSVAARFKQEPKKLVIAFSIPRSAP